MELFAADGHDAGGCERVTGKSGMRPVSLDEYLLHVTFERVVERHRLCRSKRPVSYLRQASQRPFRSHVLVKETWNRHHRQITRGTRTRDGARGPARRKQCRAKPLSGLPRGRSSRLTKTTRTQAIVGTRERCARQVHGLRLVRGPALAPVPARSARPVGDGRPWCASANHAAERLRQLARRARSTSGGCAPPRSTWPSDAGVSRPKRPNSIGCCQDCSDEAELGVPRPGSDNRRLRQLSRMGPARRGFGTTTRPRPDRPRLGAASTQGGSTVV